MNELIINGTQSFMEKEIPVISGGFGAGKKCVSDKTIAEIHEQPVTEIRRRVSDNIKRFTENVDFIDFKKVMADSHNNLLDDLGYTKMQSSKAEHIYILSERGYAKLIKIMDTDLAWEIHDKLIDEYFEMKKEINQLSPELQMFKNIFDAVAKQELLASKANETSREALDRVESIREVVALDTTSWRDDTRNLINKMANELGGGQAFSQVRSESYELLDKRMGVNLKQRLTNKTRRMAEEGICKSRRDKLSCMDIIAEDKKLIEGYTAIIKEMAIRYGVA